MRKLYWTAITIGLCILLADAFHAQKPKGDAFADLHPNIIAAQKSTKEAWDKVVAAEKAHEFAKLDLHAQRAKESLDMAIEQLQYAAEAAKKEKK